MTKPKVSIIVPVYKVEKYIERCVISLFEQTLPELEYIFIDDCGGDKSIEIVKKISKSYPNRQPQIKIIVHESNVGVSKSRQDGIDNASGEYIIHCDPDDWVEESMCQEMYDFAVSTNSDVIISDFYIHGKKETVVSQKPSSFESSTVMREMFQHLHGSCCNKLIKTSFIKNKDIQFNPRISYCEDLLFNISLLKQKPKVNYIHKAYYHYYYNLNSNSVTRLYSEEEYNKDLYLYNEILSLTKNTSSYLDSKKSLSYIINWRAFRGSQLSNWAFARRFHKYIFPVIKSKASIPIKVLLILANLGLFNFSKKIYCRLKE